MTPNPNLPRLPAQSGMPSYSQTPSLDPKAQLLQDTMDLYRQELTAGIVNIWKRTLDDYSLNDLEFAFAKWQDNEHFAPQPADIRDVIDAKHKLASEAFMLKNPEKYERHGMGFNELDVKLLWKMFHKKYPKKLRRRLSEVERRELISELEAARKPA